jgi:putative phosphoesterase
VIPPIRITAQISAIARMSPGYPLLASSHPVSAFFLPFAESCYPLGSMLAVIADTHMPKGSRRLPDRCLELIAGADATIHVGDFFAASVLAELEALCPVVHAVHGNVDEPALRERLPPRLEIAVGAHRVGLIHDAGPAKGRLARMRAAFPEADALVIGHSHLPLHEADADGFQIFNPGSPTERRRAPRRSMGLLRDGESLEFEHVWLT